MEKKGSAVLPLHYGHPPEYLYRRMVKLGGIMSDLIIERFGVSDYLEKLSDPFWFHSLSLAIGFDWNSSGTTTATLGALKEYFWKRADPGVFILGGKGAHISEISGEFELLVSRGIISESKAHKIKEDARRIAKVDQNLLQDGFDLYMQFLILDHSGKWAIVQQGMNAEQRMARRYHWLHRSSLDFLNDGRNGISSTFVAHRPLNLSTSRSSRNRDGMLEMARDNPLRYRHILQSGSQRTLDSFNLNEPVLRMDYRINWERLRQIYEYQPTDFQELAFMQGVGKSTIRALSYLSEIVYGDPPSFTDPVKFSFALGGKDGVPKPVNVADYDRAIEYFSELLRGTTLHDSTLENLSRKMSAEARERTGI
ncbi:MAG: DUF763 domain-containing protein [Candidatus Thermoplasmatota archaeon]|nr:DUF763 domain-containing protein [Candidatus Thermoplasmatota archaeon]